MSALSMSRSSECPVPKILPARLLLADPAWKFKDALPGKGRGASKHYKCLTVPELMRFPLPPIADDALLALWRVGAMQLAAFKVAEAWGFGTEPTGEIVWIKTKSGTRPTKAARMGMGRTVRNAHEICLLFKRGRWKPDHADVLSTIFAPREEHSRKPDVSYLALERLSAGPRVELFARRGRPGWSCYGDELDGGVLHG